MVKLKFIVRDGFLVLRISEGKERYYKSVKSILIGNPNILKHWKADKERFSTYATSYQENNKALEDFKQVYRKLCLEHPEYNARQVASYYSHSKILNKTNGIETEAAGSAMFLEQFMEVVIEREKQKQGCNFECYEKLLTKCRKIIPDFNLIKFSDINYDFCSKIAGIFAKYNGFKGTAKTFRAILGRASKDREVDFSLVRIGDFNFNDYNPTKYEDDMKHPDVLTKDQIKDFMHIDLFNLTPEWTNREKVELYYDFCVFMLQSFFAPCDVIKLKVEHITRNHTILARRKKTHKMVEIPITPKMEEVINKYAGQSKDGYVFPIMDDEEEKKHVTKDYIFKKFRQKLNIWLKDVGEELQCDFDLYAYVFRHTAITVALDHGLPIAYIASVAGTSVDVIQKHYYNGNSVDNQLKLQQAFMQACI